MYGQMALGTGRVPPVPFSQPKNLFRYGEQVIYSTQLHQAGAIANASFRLFATPVGQVGQGFTNALSIAETNLKEGGRVPQESDMTSSVLLVLLTLLLRQMILELSILLLILRLLLKHC